VSTDDGRRAALALDRADVVVAAVVPGFSVFEDATTDAHAGCGTRCLLPGRPSSSRPACRKQLNGPVE
jgi:hypothetical protein